VKIFMDSLDGTIPKRGDILQTNVGDVRERTCLILRVHRSARSTRRFHVWAERWWQLEPDFRMRLFRSAQRAGGQSVIYFTRYKPKPRNRRLADLWLE
jgi:hypothetical protein